MKLDKTFRAYRACTLLLILAFTAALLIATPALAEEYRAWWVASWGSPGMMNQTDVNNLLGVVGDPNSLGHIREANCNAVFVEVRRSSDVCYPSGLGEPYFSGLTPSKFNALQAIINAAHDTTGGKKRIEVHAWMVVFRTNGNSVYSAHDDPPTGSLTNLDNYWPTRTDAGAEPSGQAFDPGHPLVEDYLTKVFLDIVNNFDIDGIHYDYIRFTGRNQGYNPTSVARYNARHGLSGDPAWNDAQWKQWRRDQITNLVRRIYHKVQIVKPSIKVSGAFVCGHPEPPSATRSAFTGYTQAYNDHYQDWDSWLQEGIVDMACPMTYFDYAGSHQQDWFGWLTFQKDRHGNRHMITGPGLYMNSLSNAILELQQVRTPSSNGNKVQGFSGYDYKTPYSGGSWSSWAPTFKSQITPTWDDIPAMPWKVSPTKAHIHGTVYNGSKWVDGAHITLIGPDMRTQDADGTGFFGFTDVSPGTYTVTCNATAQGLGTQNKTITVSAGEVAVVNFTWGTTTGMSGYVRNSAGVPVPGARIIGANGAYLSTSGADGFYTLPGMTAGTYSFKCTKANYTTQTKNATVTAGSTATVNFTINSTISGGTISGYVRDSQNHGIPGATVATGSGGYSTTTGADGSYSLYPVAAGTYSVTASIAGHTNHTVTGVTVTDGGTAVRDFTINPDATVITSVMATNITSDSATIIWTTNVPATGRVEYGPTHAMGTLTPLDSTLVKSHSVTLTGLTPNHIYHYRVTSANSLGVSATSADSLFFTSAPSGTGATVIVDNQDPGWSVTAGTWLTGSGAGMYGTDYRFADTLGEFASCKWTPDLPHAGTYDVYIWYRQGTNRANDAPFTINYQGGSIVVPVNQQINGGGWFQIGTSLPFAAGTTGNVSLTDTAQASKVVMADAVKWVSISPSDTTPPTVPTGLSATATSTTQIQVTWSASTDASGIGGYRIYRNGVLIDAVDSGTSYTESGLAPNTSYTYTVAAFDIWGNLSAQSSPITKSTLCLPISVTCNKPVRVWQTADNTFTFTNTVGFGGQTIHHIRYVWDRQPTHTWTNTETSWSSGTQVCTASPGGSNWYFHARAYNADNVPNGQVDLGPFFCDTTPPISPLPTVTPYVTSTSQLSATWTATSDSESGIVEYQYAIGTTPGATNVKGWATVGINTSVTATGLSLALDQRYYFTLKAKNGAGVWGEPRSSESTTPARVLGSIAEARQLDNNRAVILTKRHVGYGASDGAFIQDPNRAAALYLPGVSYLSTNNFTDVGGFLGTSGLHRVLNEAHPDNMGGPVNIDPLMMRLSDLGGAQLNEWTPGMPGAVGLNNLGLLVKVFGTVTASTPTYFMLSDGTREVQVRSNANPGSGHVFVTGISSWTTHNGQTIPLIITRFPADVKGPF